MSEQATIVVELTAAEARAVHTMAAFFAERFKEYGIEADAPLMTGVVKLEVALILAGFRP